MELAVLLLILWPTFSNIAKLICTSQVHLSLDNAQFTQIFKIIKFNASFPCVNTNISIHSALLDNYLELWNDLSHLKTECFDKPKCSNFISTTNIEPCFWIIKVFVFLCVHGRVFLSGFMNLIIGWYFEWETILPMLLVSNWV